MCLNLVTSSTRCIQIALKRVFQPTSSGTGVRSETNGFELIQSDACAFAKQWQLFDAFLRHCLSFESVIRWIVANWTTRSFRSCYVCVSVRKESNWPVVRSSPADARNDRWKGRSWVKSIKSSLFAHFLMSSVRDPGRARGLNRHSRAETKTASIQVYRKSKRHLLVLVQFKSKSQSFIVVYDLLLYGVWIQIRWVE